MQGEGYEREARPWLVRFSRLAGDDGGRREGGLRLVEMPRRRSGYQGLTKLTGGRRGAGGLPRWCHGGEDPEVCTRRCCRDQRGGEVHTTWVLLRGGNCDGAGRRAWFGVAVIGKKEMGLRDLGNRD